MRQILVNHAKRRRAASAVAANKVALVEAEGLVQAGASGNLVALNEALEKLARSTRDKSRIVELHTSRADRRGDQDELARMHN